MNEKIKRIITMTKPAAYTMDHIEWRDSEIADTVAFLDRVNPKGYSAEDIKAHAFRVWAENGYLIGDALEEAASAIRAQEPRHD
jgi:hypothetical protein